MEVIKTHIVNTVHYTREMPLPYHIGNSNPSFEEQMYGKVVPRIKPTLVYECSDGSLYKKIGDDLVAMTKEEFNELNK